MAQSPVPSTSWSDPFNPRDHTSREPQTALRTGPACEAGCGVSGWEAEPTGRPHLRSSATVTRLLIPLLFFSYAVPFTDSLHCRVPEASRVSRPCSGLSAVWGHRPWLSLRCVPGTSDGARHTVNAH